MLRDGETPYAVAVCGCGHGDCKMRRNLGEPKGKNKRKGRPMAHLITWLAKGLDAAVDTARKHKFGIVVTHRERVVTRKGMVHLEGPIDKFVERDAYSDEEDGEPWGD